MATQNITVENVLEEHDKSASTESTGYRTTGFTGKRCYSNIGDGVSLFMSVSLSAFVFGPDLFQVSSFCLHLFLRAPAAVRVVNDLG